MTTHQINLNAHKAFTLACMQPFTLGLTFLPAVWYSHKSNKEWGRGYGDHYYANAWQHHAANTILLWSLLFSVAVFVIWFVMGVMAYTANAKAYEQTRTDHCIKAADMMQIDPSYCLETDPVAREQLKSLAEARAIG